MTTENLPGLFALFVATLIVLGLWRTFFGGPAAPKRRKDWPKEQGTLRITRRNPDAVGGVSVSLYSGRRDVVTWDWENIISVEEVK